MDGTKYHKLIMNRVLPAAASRFPDCHMIFFNDQAPYHVVRSGFLDVSKDSKIKIFRWLLDNDVHKLRVIRFAMKKKGEQQVIPPAPPTIVDFDLLKLADKPHLPNAPVGPSKDELLYAAYLFCLKFKKEALQIDIETKVNQMGHYMIWNVPNHPQYNPSEYLNGHLKLNVRENYITGRGMNGLWNDILIGINGGMRHNGRLHKAATPQMCMNWMAKCLGVMETEGKQLGLGDKIIDFWMETEGKQLGLGDKIIDFWMETEGKQ
eukprot:354838_1